MRIAQVAPLYESVPPQLYGGTERVVSYLTEALVEMGHEVTLFASGDSVTRAKLVAACPRSLAAPRSRDGDGFRGCFPIRRYSLPHRLPAFPYAPAAPVPKRHNHPRAI